jgi:hypothetical protein
MNKLISSANKYNKLFFVNIKIKVFLYASNGVATVWCFCLATMCTAVKASFVWFYVSKMFLKNFKKNFIFYFALNLYVFYIFKLFWYVDVKNNFKKIKNILF